ncbi:MAG: insulinase family protein [Coriobacteriales bacterium]|jgi:predicted Zn-dependent peptidase|nr:insulinase family protein [Coriobacteriales bacterium]
MTKFVTESKLSNGIRLITERMEGVRSVAFGTWFRVGSRDENDETSGISHFLEHMSFKGTKTRNLLDISMAFEGIGAEFNAFTSSEYTCYHARFMDEHLPLVIELFADMTINSTFSEEAITTERDVVLEEIARYEDEPDENAFRLFHESLFPTHQLGRPVLGSRSIVAAFNHQSCDSYHKHNYNANNCVLVATGNVDHDALHDLCEQWFAAMPTGTLNTRGEVGEQKRRLFSTLQKETEQAHMLYGMYGVDLQHDLRYAAKILDVALGGTMSSRLFQEIREKRGLAYAVYAGNSAFMNAGEFSIYVGTRPDNIQEAVGIIRHELDDILNGGLSLDEITRARDYLVGQIALSSESSNNRMHRIGRSAVNGLNLISFDELIEQYKAVTLQNVNDVAQFIFRQDPTIAVVSPLVNDELVQRLGISL